MKPTFLILIVMLVLQLPALAQDKQSNDSAQNEAWAAADNKNINQSLLNVLRWSYENNPTIRAARNELLATQERLPQAQSGWKPTITATTGVNQAYTESDPTALNRNATNKNANISLDQPLYRGGRTIANTQSATNVILAQRAFLDQTEEDVLLDAVTAYMNVLRDQSLLELQENNKKLLQEQLDASNARFQVKTITVTDLAQSKARLQGAESLRVSALANLRTSLAEYQRITGLNANSLTFPQVNVSLPKTLEESIAVAEKQNPQVVATLYLKDAADNDIDSVFGELLPSISLVGSVNHDSDPASGIYDRQTSYSVGVSVSIPLYEAGATRSRLRQAKDTAQQREYLIDEARKSARSQAISNWENLMTATTVIASRLAQVESNQIARDGVYKEAELGGRTVLDKLNADQELLTSKSDLVTAQRNEVVAKFSLASTLGFLRPDTLGFPEAKRNYDEHLDEIQHKIFSIQTEYNPIDAVEKE